MSLGSGDNRWEPVQKASHSVRPLVFLHECVFPWGTGTPGFFWLFLSCHCPFVTNELQEGVGDRHEWHFCIFCFCSLRATSGRQEIRGVVWAVSSCCSAGPFSAACLLRSQNGHVSGEMRTNLRAWDPAAPWWSRTSYPNIGFSEASDC